MTTDEAGFRERVEREYRPLARGISLYCGERRIDEELVQDAFARAYQRWGHVRKMARPGAWLYTVAFNLASAAPSRRPQR